MRPEYVPPVLQAKVIFTKVTYTYQDTNRVQLSYRAEVDRDIGPILVIQYDDEETLFWMLDQMLPKVDIEVPAVWNTLAVSFPIDPRSRSKT